MGLPRGGGVLLSLADTDKSDAAPMIETLVRLGHPLYATEGTAAFIDRLGHAGATGDEADRPG